MKVTIDENLKGKELFDFLVANKNILIAEKKYNVKHSDAFGLPNLFIDTTGNVQKGAYIVKDDTETIQVPCVINTTFWFDGHKDVHIDGIWDKSLSENKSLYLLQEHSMTFKGIITDDIKAYTKSVSWKSIGYNASGNTQALVFDSTISKSRNEFMFHEYKNGHVKNHSAGMQYKRIEMAINDEDYKEEFAVWQKYIDRIANKEEAETEGYFFAVKEARIIEGSAVPIGSNRMTPVLGQKSDTEVPPSLDTEVPPSQKAFDIQQLITNFQFT